jgi:hypothetical protein
MTEKVNEKKVVGRTVAIVLGIICIVLAVGIVGAIVNYTSIIISGKDSTIATQNSQISSLNSQIVAKNSQISNLQKWLNGNITLAYDSGYKAGVTSRGFDIVDPTYQQMSSFMATDTIHYNVYSSTYICWNFCNDYINEAFRAGWRCGFVYISYPNSAHGAVCFNTTDRGIVFVEPQFNEIVRVALGLSYSRDNGFTPATFNDTIMHFGIIW